MELSVTAWKYEDSLKIKINDSILFKVLAYRCHLLNVNDEQREENLNEVIFQTTFFRS